MPYINCNPLLLWACDHTCISEYDPQISLSFILGCATILTEYFLEEQTHDKTKNVLLSAEGH